MAHGQCLCGGLRYEMNGPFSFFGHCHCSMCRKHHGASFATFVAGQADDFVWNSGADDVVTFVSSENGRRGFCPTCGSVAPAVAGGQAIAPAGNLAGELGLEPQMHMFVASKAPWTRINDALPAYDEYPPEFPGRGVERRRVAHKPGVLQGSCLCGEVAFEFEGEVEDMRNCHCGRCRLARSAAFATNLFGPTEQLRFLRGADLVVDYQLPEAERFGVAFCRHCGGHVARALAGRPYAVIPAGSLDADPGSRPSAHIFVGSKAPWMNITDGLPQYEEYPVK